VKHLLVKPILRVYIIRFMSICLSNPFKPLTSFSVAWASLGNSPEVVIPLV
jgi:hypothetical protein